MQEMSTTTAAFENRLQVLIDKELAELEAKVQNETEVARNSQIVGKILKSVQFNTQKLLTLVEDIINEYSGVTEITQNQILESNHEFRKSMR